MLVSNFQARRLGIQGVTIVKVTGWNLKQLKQISHSPKPLFMCLVALYQAYPRTMLPLSCLSFLFYKVRLWAGQTLHLTTLLRTFLPLDTGFLGTYNFLNFFFYCYWSPAGRTIPAAGQVLIGWKKKKGETPQIRCMHWL